MLTVLIGKKLQLRVTAEYGDVLKRVPPGEATYMVDPPSLGEVDAAGVYTARSEGEGAIGVVYAGREQIIAVKNVALLPLELPPLSGLQVEALPI